MLNYQPTSIKYNNEVKIRAFRKDNADYVTTRSIAETIMLQTGAMNANTLKIFNFSRYETPIKINSIYVSSSDADKTQINLIVKIESQIIFDFTLASNVIPYAFPYLVLFPFNTVTVKPKFNITDCYIYAEPNYVLDVYSL